MRMFDAYQNNFFEVFFWGFSFLNLTTEGRRETGVPGVVEQNLRSMMTASKLSLDIGACTGPTPWRSTGTIIKFGKRSTTLLMISQIFF